jgi:hypothetical protein
MKVPETLVSGKHITTTHIINEQTNIKISKDSNITLTKLKFIPVLENKESLMKVFDQWKYINHKNHLSNLHLYFIIKV